jgi:hypothetical protein
MSFLHCKTRDLGGTARAISQLDENLPKKSCCQKSRLQHVWFSTGNRYLLRSVYEVLDPGQIRTASDKEIQHHSSSRLLATHHNFDEVAKQRSPNNYIHYGCLDQSDLRNAIDDGVSKESTAFAPCRCSRAKRLERGLMVRVCFRFKIATTSTIRLDRQNSFNAYH